MNVRASEIAEFLDVPLLGVDIEINNINSLENSTETELSFREEGYDVSISESNAGAVICPTSTAEHSSITQIPSENPRVDFMKVVEEFFTSDSNETKIHDTAVVADGAKIGEGCIIGPNAVITEAVSLEANCRVGPAAIIGVPGLHAVRDRSGKLLQMKHQGEVIIEEGVTIQAGAFVQRAVFEETIIESRSWIGNYCGIGHNVTVGEDTWIAPFVPVGGSVTIDPKVTIHLGACIGRHCEIGEYAVIGSNSTVLDNVPPSTKVVGTPAKPIDDIKR